MRSSDLFSCFMLIKQTTRIINVELITSQERLSNYQENQKAATGYKRQTSNKIELAASDYLKAA
jgi:hypothetical protein